MINLTTLSSLGLLALATTVRAQDAAPKLTWHDIGELTLEGLGWHEAEAPFARLPARAKDRVTKPVWLQTPPPRRTPGEHARPLAGARARAATSPRRPRRKRR